MLHLFYGVACTGKSTLALHYASTHNIHTIIHTDYVREVQRACMQPSEASHPLTKVTHNAWELFGEPSDENIRKGFIAHVDAVTPALVAVVRKLSLDGCNAIVEGVHCYSAVLDRLALASEMRLCPRLLVVTHESQLLARIQHKEAMRSRSGEPKAWQTHLTTLLTIQAFLLHDAIQHGIHIHALD